MLCYCCCKAMEGLECARRFRRRSASTLFLGAFVQVVHNGTGWIAPQAETLSSSDELSFDEREGRSWPGTKYPGKLRLRMHLRTHLECHSVRLEGRSLCLEGRSPRLEGRSPRPEGRSPHPEGRSLRLERPG